VMIVGLLMMYLGPPCTPTTWPIPSAMSELTRSQGVIRDEEFLLTLPHIGARRSYCIAYGAYADVLPSPRLDVDVKGKDGRHIVMVGRLKNSKQLLEECTWKASQLYGAKLHGVVQVESSHSRGTRRLMVLLRVHKGGKIDALTVCGMQRGRNAVILISHCYGSNEEELKFSLGLLKSLSKQMKVVIFKGPKSPTTTSRAGEKTTTKVTPWLGGDWS